MSVFKGTSGPDEIFGTNLADHISGRDGDDTIHGLSGDDIITGGVGDDILYGGAGNDRIDGGGPGSDTIYGGDGDDMITDHYVPDNQFFGPGAPGGTDAIYGGAGNDRIIVRYTYNPFSSIYPEGCEIFGDDGDDLVWLDWGVEGALFGGAGDDRLTLGGYGGVLNGGDGDDLLLGQRRSHVYDTVNFDKYSPGGNTVFDGGAGNDVMIAHGYGGDTIVLAPLYGHDVVKNFNTNGDYAPVDRIDLTAFGLTISAEEVIDTFSTQRGDKTILRMAPDATLVIEITDVVPAWDLTDSLIL
jgi:Ca2+-binding RTX toxin-like protein